MIFLQSHDRFDEFATFDPITGKQGWYSKQANPELAKQLLGGHISRLDGRILCLYKIADTLHFRCDNEDLILTDETVVDLESISNDFNRILIRRNQETLFDRTCRQPPFIPRGFDPTPMAEDEDFDFGLFVYNVANNPGRKKRIYSMDLNL